MEKVPVILVTDGDHYAFKAVHTVAIEINAECITATKGNPSILTGEQIVRLIKKASKTPVFVMFDDSGYIGEGPGETALRYVATHKEIYVLGVIAVAAKTKQAEWTKVHVSIDREGNLTEYGVDKYGIPDTEIGRINGDTVYCIDELNIPVVVGVGDIGKMGLKDHFSNGSPVTKLAVELILERSGYQ